MSILEAPKAANSRCICIGIIWRLIRMARLVWGEYTFQYRVQTHGVVVVKIENGLIKNWREYEIESELPWDQFVGTNRF